ncbi:MAG TPA: ABC transporter ATP-binding protein [Hypericibacter adhaerens]|uniref:ABC transporter ATP-binding protein n=1 Tax=Hypericibacter adhaerens TaxID=2602016 RepID=UPI002CD35AE5|nr:ABC transporter ATP-binding protein [Hypericibacter adhaerens]HWA44625.1 ABC transporter ATP-binding protein [Hypericibacter adhaerens]
MTVSFGPPGHRIPIVQGVDFQLERGRILGIVGESGSGKSVTCLALMRLLARSAAVGGRAELDGEDLLALDESRMVAARGGQIAMIFQDPAASLNPVRSIGWQLAEAINLGAAVPSRAAVRARALQLLRDVGMPDPARRLGEYPHQLSGGMNQRALIAMMLARSPKLLIADEPTTALDVTIQAQILRLLLDLRDRLGMTIILVSHDLGVIAETCDQVAVMYCGRIVEMGDARDLFLRPQHPYTIGLLNSRPRVDGQTAALRPIEGVVPPPHALPPGCAFSPRCSRAGDACDRVAPPLEERRDGHRVACFHPAGAAA